MRQHCENFAGARYIFAPYRRKLVDAVWKYVEEVKMIKARFPHLVAGLDLVGQEDAGHPFSDFVEPLSALSGEGVNIPVFYDAGETNW